MAYPQKNYMVLVFKTNSNKGHEMVMRNLLSKNHRIQRIDFDFEDCDNILRIESKEDVSEDVIIALNSLGLYCKELED